MKGRRILAIVLAAALALSLFLLPASAVSTYDFLFNDTIWQFSADTPLVERDGFTCMPMDRFLRQFGFTYIYDDTIKNLTLFRYGNVYSFNIVTSTCSVNRKPPVSAPAFYENGAFYLPMEFMAEQMGYIFTVLDNGVGRLITQPVRYTDEQYERMYASMYAASAARKSTPTFYLMIADTDGSQTARVLPAVRSAGIPAAFFLSERAIRSRPDLVRRIFAEGYTLGLLIPEGASGSSALASVNAANDLLQKLTKRRAVLVMPESSARDSVSEGTRQQLEGAGYRLWQCNFYLPSSEDASLSTEELRDTFLSPLPLIQWDSAVCIPASGYAVSMIQTVADGAASGRYVLRQAGEFVTPLNFLT